MRYKEKLEPSNFDLYKMFFQAQAFEETADKLGDFETEGQVPEGHLWLPWIVNKVFQVELLFKILLLVENKTDSVKKGKHDLYKLYCCLDEDVRMHLHTIGVFSDELLKESSDLFVTCRYIYEYKGAIVNGIPTLISVAKAAKREAVERLFKTDSTVVLRVNEKEIDTPHDVI